MALLNPSMEDLPVLVMVDILSRLPVKTIIHCKFVCKKWLDLVSDSYFANLHLLRSPASLMIHHHSEKEKADYHPHPGILKLVEVEDELDRHNLHHDPVMTFNLNLAPIFQESLLHLVGSVNGLICLWEYGNRKDNTYIRNPITRDNTYICNPITREYMILPRHQYYRHGYAIVVYCFGVGSVTKEYKVVRVFQRYIPSNSTSTSRPSILEAEVYTLGTGQWRSLGHVPYWLNRVFGTFLNGHAHWIVLYQDSLEKLCAFDFNKETFGLFPSPPIEIIEESRIHFRSLGVLKGCLCQSYTFDSQVTIWVMKEYGVKKSWHKEVVIKQSINPYLDWSMWECVDLIERLKDGTVLLVPCEDTLLAYSPQTGTIERTGISDQCFSGMAYRPSFLKLQNFESERVHVV